MGGRQKYSHLFDDDDEEPQPSAAETSLSQDLEKALTDAKAVGNSLFQEGRYDDASAAYKQGLDLFEGTAGDVPKGSLGVEVQKLATALYCNSSHSQLKGRGSRSACAGRSRVSAEKALALDPLNVKALFRRGCAFAFAEDWTSAIQDFQYVLELEPGSEAARRELEKAQEQEELHGSEPMPELKKSHLLLSDQERLETIIADAEDEKARGTRLFMEKKYAEAVEVWRQALAALSEIPEDEHTAEVHKLMVALCNNAAQACLNWHEVQGANTKLAAQYATKALELEPSNIKALFRRGCAQVNSEEWHLARQDFEHVLELEPGNTAAQEELEKMKAAGVLDNMDDAEGNTPDLSNPAVAVKMAQQEVDRFRREILALADRQGQGGVSMWCQRFNKMQVQAAAWAQHQLADAEGLQDLITLRGPVFAAMDDKQKEDFIAACEFLSEMRSQYGWDIDELMASNA